MYMQMSKRHTAPPIPVPLYFQFCLSSGSASSHPGPSPVEDILAKTPFRNSLFLFLLHTAPNVGWRTTKIIGISFRKGEIFVMIIQISDTRSAIRSQACYAKSPTCFYCTNQNFFSLLHRNHLRQVSRFIHIQPLIQ